MPKVLETLLKKKAKKLFGTTKSKKANAYVFGTMRKTGWVPSTQKGKNGK